MALLKAGFFSTAYTPITRRSLLGKKWVSAISGVVVRIAVREYK
jgi:hypothetical protein